MERRELRDVHVEGREKGEGRRERGKGRGEKGEEREEGEGREEGREEEGREKEKEKGDDNPPPVKGGRERESGERIHWWT